MMLEAEAAQPRVDRASGQDAPGSSRPPWLWSVACTLVLGVAGLLYVPGLSGEVVWDDRWLLGGEAIGGGKSLLECLRQPFLNFYFRPLVSVSFYVENHLWHGAPLGYHVTNLLIHVAATGAAMGLVHAAFRRRRVTLAAGLLFAVQPVQVGATAWVGGRTDALAVLFSAAFGWALVSATRARGERRSLLLGGAVAAYALALLSKEQTLALLPLVPLAFACFPPDHGRHPRGAGWWALVPFAVATAAFVAMLAFVGPPRAAHIPWTLGELAAHAGQTVLHYAALLLVPLPAWLQTYTLGRLEPLGWWAAAAGYGTLLAAAGVFVWLLRRDRAAAWFLALVLLALLPVSNLVPLPYILVAPYRAAVSGIGVACLLGYALARTIAQQAARGRGAVGPAVLALLLAWWAGLSAWGILQWQDDATFFRSVARSDPYCVVAHYNLANLAGLEGRDRDAERGWETLLQRLFRSRAWRSPADASRVARTDRLFRARLAQGDGNAADPLLWLTGVYARLGFARMRLSAPISAQQAFDTAQAIQPGNADVLVGLGYLDALAGDDRAAETRFRGALRADPTLSEAHRHLGEVLARHGRWEEARAEFTAWRQSSPDAPEAYLALANAQARTGDRTGGLSTLREAVRRFPERADLRSAADQLAAWPG